MFTPSSMSFEIIESVPCVTSGSRIVTRLVRVWRHRNVHEKKRQTFRESWNRRIEVSSRIRTRRDISEDYGGRQREGRFSHLEFRPTNEVFDLRIRMGISKNYSNHIQDLTRSPENFRGVHRDCTSVPTLGDVAIAWKLQTRPFT